MTTPAQLHAQIQRVTRGAFDKIETHPMWERAAADTVLQLPGLQSAFAAVERVAAELARHKGESWGEHSDTTTCAACRSAWPCQTFTTLSGGNQ